MEQIRTYSDQRLDDWCSYCGDFPGTRDHVPSRILLDEPYPENLPVVPCCLKCNSDFSLDEEYLACVIECVLHGTTDVAKLNREKVKVILSRKDVLKQRIESSFVLEDGKKFFKIEEDRLKNVVIKLAKGHAKYENSEPQYNEPSDIWIKPLITLTEDEADNFFSPTTFHKAPEVGSRALQQLIIDNDRNVLSHWTTVQEGNYQYSVSVGLGLLTVKIVIWDYLAVVVTWN